MESAPSLVWPSCPPDLAQSLRGLAGRPRGERSQYLTPGPDGSWKHAGSRSLLFPGTEQGLQAWSSGPLAQADPPNPPPWN